MKNIIKKYLNETFLTEEKKPIGLTGTEKVQKDEDDTNKEYYKEVNKKMEDYEDSITGEKENSEAVKKYENNDAQKDFHDEYEILNGQEMIRYDNEPSKQFKDRAIKAIEGDPTMGNSNEWANVVTADQAGFTGPDFGKDLVKRIKARDKKEVDSTNTMVQFGDDIEITDEFAPKISKRKVAVDEGMKRLVFKKPFNGVENAIKLIPETYKVDDKVFQMTDGNENYEIRWEGSLKEGKAIVLMGENKTLVNEDMQKMKHLMGYKSHETLGKLKATDRLNENEAFKNIWNKTGRVLSEAKFVDEVTEDRYEGKLEQIISDLESIRGGLDGDAMPRVFVMDNLIHVSAEDGQYFADYYGEMSGGYPTVADSLEELADKYDTYWEWLNPGAVVLTPLD